MALTLPLNFENDIIGRNTALVPVITIGTLSEMGNDGHVINFINQSHFLSTNSGSFTFTSDEGTVTKNYLPLLLNVPSLKESIDIEKRNYKISSVNLDISNFSYEGQRFSELVGDNSLINTEVRIYWVSPSTNLIHPKDYGYNSDATNEANHAFQIYFGTIRRYDHDDEKVRLVVEDRSQAILHKDLPTANLGTGDEVPDKYKNKPIPMVYGRVERSPCVIKRSPLSTEWGLDYGDIDIYPDFVAPVSIANQYVYFGGKYLHIPTILYDPNYSNLFGLSEESINIIDTSITDFIRLQSINSNPISRNLIPTKESRTFDDMVVLPLREKTTDLNSYISADSTNYTSVYRSDTKEVMGSFVRDHYGGGNLAYWDGTSRLQEIEGTSSDIFWDLVVNDSSEDVALPACLLETGVANGPFEKTIGVIDFDIDTYYGNVLASSGNHNIRLSIQGGSKILFNSIAENFSDTGAGWHETNLDGTDVFVIKSGEGGSVDRLRVAFWGYISSGGVICAGKLKFNTFNLNRYGLIEDVNNQDFYANVTGRGNRFCTSIDAIENILEQELGVSVPYQHPGIYSGWVYAFTVDKKISSKKLIEGIASASPFIPRFNNMGEFKFVKIPDDGGSVTTNSDESVSPNHTIKEAEVIDFSFSRTKIEDVCTKVIFKYNWDYARGEFNDSVESFASEILGNDIYDYYGFQETGDDPDAESTVTIDDDRGKYIREGYTAQDFADWYLLWNANQHLKMKVKLPLKYMNLEIGDFIDFDAILGGVNPYGINYIEDGEVNGQEVFKTFLITSTNKTLEWVEIECVQMHGLDASRLSGCNDDGYQQWSPYPGTPACNYNEDDITNNNCEYVMDCTYDPSDDSTWEDACGGKAEVDFCGVCGGNTVYDDCGDCPGEGLEEDECGVCRTSDDELANSTCLDCSGVPNGNAEFDNCGVCGGENADCIQACDGNWYDIERDDIPEEDECGVCGGDGSTCMQCPEDGIVTLWGVDYDVATTTSINLENQGLSGSIPPEIGCLTNLTYLSLSYNQLSGEIPSSIGDLTNLYSLRLRDNQLIGEIPSEIGQLTNLTSLSLSYNQLTGEIPSEIGNLTNLTYLLYLHNNQLTGEIPPEIGNLTNLNQLWLKNNQLSGEIPPSICNIAGSSPNVGSNLLCPQYFGTENEEYPSCISDSDIEDQDTSGCGEYAYPGDMNGDGLFNVLDVVALVNCILTIVGGGSCPPQGDLNGDGSWNVLDIVQLTNCVLDGNCGG